MQAKNPHAKNCVKPTALFFSLFLLLLAVASPSRAQSDVFQKWVEFFSPAQSFDQPTAMALDSQGNIIVVGAVCVDDPCSIQESYTIKYDLDGNTLWRASLFGPSDGTEITATALKVAVDSADNVYVLSVLNPNSTDPDIALAKYSPSGTRQWVDFVSSTLQNLGTDGAAVIPGTLAVASNGDTYLSYSTQDTTTFSANCPAFLVKRDPTGKQIWSQEVNPTTPNCNSIPFIGLDSSENVYALFFNFFSSQIHGSEIVKFNSAGTQLSSFAGNDLGTIGAFRVDADSNSYVAGGGSPQAPHGTEDRIVAKYNSSGVREWLYDIPVPTDTIPAPSGFVDLALDPAAEVFVAWTRTLATGGSDISILKFSSTGTREWTTSYNGRPSTSPGSDQAVALVANSLGYVYVTGNSADPSRSCCFDQIVTIKYDPKGSTVWAERFARSGLDVGSAVAIGAFGGDLIVTGATFDGTVSGSTGSKWTTIDYVQDAAKASPTSLTFGDQALQTQSAAQTVTLKNTAETPLEITGIDATGDFQVHNGCPATLAGGASCTFQVTFRPSATGTRTGTVTIHDNWAGSVSDPQIVQLRGTGVS